MPHYTPDSLPDGCVTISDDTEACEFLAELDILDKLPSPGSLSESAVSATYDGHVTHWIVGMRYEGYPDPADNGFCVHCFPKSQFSLADVMKGLKLTYTQHASETDPQGPFRDYGYTPL